MPSINIEKVKTAVLKYSGIKKREPQTHREPEDAHRRKYVKSLGDSNRKGFRDPNFLHSIR